MKRILMVGVSLVLGMALASEARDWGFSKDTVYSWSAGPGGGDSVWVLNGGTDTVVLDSVITEDVIPYEWMDVSFLHRAINLQSSGYYYQDYTLIQNQRLRTQMVRGWVPPNDSVLILKFSFSNFCITKYAAGSSMSPDTLAVRLRFKSLASEEDTLIVKGHYCFPNAIKPQGSLRPNDSFELLDRDLKGRRVLPSRNFPALRR